MSEESIVPQPPMIVGSEIKRAERIVYPESPVYKRVRFLSILMDQSILLPGGYRIGLDPILGLIPGLGDFITTSVSAYMVYLAARLGLPKRVLVRMGANIALETLVGIFPIIGDLFDMVWKANVRNLRLIDRHYHPSMPGRPAGRIILTIVLVLALVLGVMVGLSYMVIQFIVDLFNAIRGAAAG